ncbi:hypothetical protein TSUD_264390 [Trifolium subterraneum]|uniref:RNase III domain-containing protein n=1 Tax=Trifolium subterraneum TaxID=3900 RepID=A0A2Z6MIQ2_TRISU|nr:hypothetical protein TSUD_264390 [Trifolium subterraneum]
MKMEVSLAAVEQIIGYTFRNKKLLEEALTHTSDPKVVSYKCLKFIGNAVLGLAISNHLFLTYTFVDPGQLSFVLPMSALRNSLVSPFVMREDDCSVVLYGGSVKAPKILADIVESIAAAVYVDVDFDLKKLWVVAL